jgi:hypothetical protein
MGTVIDLTGYKYAKQVKKQDSHCYDALMYALGKSVKKTTTLEWIGVSERLPEGEIRMLAVIVRCVGNLKPYISGSAFSVEGGWRHCNSAETVTHWAELPKDLYFS